MSSARSSMICRPCESSRRPLEAAAVVGDHDHGLRRRARRSGRRSAAPAACRTALFIASWAMRNSSASTSGRSRWVCSSRVTWMGTPEPPTRLRASEPMAVPRLSLSPTLVRSVTTERRISRDDGRRSGRGACRAARPARATCAGQQVVDEVAERGDVLGDAVVHLAGQPAALLGGGGVAERREEQGGVEVHGVGPSRRVSLRIRSSTPSGGRVEPGDSTPATIAVVPASVLSGNANTWSSHQDARPPNARRRCPRTR